MYKLSYRLQYKNWIFYILSFRTRGSFYLYTDIQDHLCYVFPSYSSMPPLKEDSA